MGPQSISVFGCDLALPSLLGRVFGQALLSLQSRRPPLRALVQTLGAAPSPEKHHSIPIDPAQFNEFYRQCSRRLCLHPHDSRPRALPIESFSLSVASFTGTAHARPELPAIVSRFQMR